MADQPLTTYDLYEYTSDDGNIYDVKLMDSLATAGGWTASTEPYVNKPTGLKMRHILGFNATSGATGKLYLPQPDSTKFVTPASWTGNNGTVYQPTGGAIGEHRHAPL